MIPITFISGDDSPSAAYLIKTGGSIYDVGWRLHRRLGAVLVANRLGIGGCARPGIGGCAQTPRIPVIGIWPAVLGRVKAAAAHEALPQMRLLQEPGLLELVFPPAPDTLFEVYGLEDPDLHAATARRRRNKIAYQTIKVGMHLWGPKAGLCSSAIRGIDRYR